MGKKAKFIYTISIMTVNKTLTALYLIGFIHHIFTTFYSLIALDYSGVTDEKLLDLKNHNFRYLTTWNFLGQTWYYILAIICEIVPNIQEKKFSSLTPFVKVIKGIYFSAIIFPIGLLVTTVFWIFHSIKQEYVLPAGAYDILPVWFNHCIHTNIIFLIIVEIALGQLFVPKYTIVFTLTLFYSTTYTIQYVALYYAIGRWLYGIMNSINSTQQVLFLFEPYQTSDKTDSLQGCWVIN